MNRDKLNNLPRAQVAQVSFGVVDYLQKATPNTELAIAALSCAFLQLTRGLNVSPQSLWETANNMIHNADKKQVPEFAGILRYVREEMAK
ncbi:MAG: hypothetical protein INH37_13730 [Myxococcaceae bacterium]|nr:hypothetical protein [Myxococcaceae bacterium]